MLATGALALGGCALNRDKNPHNDVLVFATQTKFGVDISAPLNSATLPQINVGYNRSEAVWMPLRPNGTPGGVPPETDDLVRRLNACDALLRPIISNPSLRQATCLAEMLPKDKYVSLSSGVRSEVGGTGVELDTYSVFASFGARGSASGSNAGGGLAQVFATGIAAQRLASNPQVGAALNTKAPEAMVAQARADEAAALTALERRGATLAETRLATEAGLMTNIRSNWKCGDPGTDAENFQKIVADARGKYSSLDWDRIGSATTRAEAEFLLETSGIGEKDQFWKSQTAICGG